MTDTRHLGAIGLDELVESAALLSRVDRKYIVPRDEVDDLLRTLDPAARILEIDGIRDFAYESVYFDTPELLSFRMAALARRRRFKLRTRSYLDTGSAFLEVKTRGARGLTVKDRDPYALAERTRLTPSARADIGLALRSVGVDAARATDLDPTLITRYLRTTILAGDGGSRATVDTELRWQEPSGSGFALPALAIVETKSAGAASSLDRALWRRGHRPQRVSKYGTGLAALRPELPRTRWARVLRGPFSPVHRFEEESCSATA